MSQLGDPNKPDVGINSLVVNLNGPATSLQTPAPGTYSLATDQYAVSQVAPAVRTGLSSTSPAVATNATTSYQVTNTVPITTDYTVQGLSGAQPAVQVGGSALAQPVRVTTETVSVQRQLIAQPAGIARPNALFDRAKYICLALALLLILGLLLFALISFFRKPSSVIVKPKSASPTKLGTGAVQLPKLSFNNATFSLANRPTTVSAQLPKLTFGGTTAGPGAISVDAAAPKKPGFFSRIFSIFSSSKKTEPSPPATESKPGFFARLFHRSKTNKTADDKNVEEEDDATVTTTSVSSGGVGALPKLPKLRPLINGAVNFSADTGKGGQALATGATAAAAADLAQKIPAAELAKYYAFLQQQRVNADLTPEIFTVPAPTPITVAPAVQQTVLDAGKLFTLPAGSTASSGQAINSALKGLSGDQLIRLFASQLGQNGAGQATSTASLAQLANLLGKPGLNAYLASLANSAGAAGSSPLSTRLAYFNSLGSRAAANFLPDLAQRLSTAP